MLAMFQLVFREEGLGGFYGGVKGVMVGQAFIKAMEFSSNNWALAMLSSHFMGASTGLGGSGGAGGSLDDPSTSLQVLCAAAAFSGFVTSFLVNPVERVKILMQADNQGQYKNEFDCASQILKRDGVAGFLGRGLEATLAREIPGYGLYFVAYSLLMQSEVGRLLGPTGAPLVCGAAAGNWRAP